MSQLQCSLKMWEKSRLPHKMGAKLAVLAVEMQCSNIAANFKALALNQKIEDFTYLEYSVVFFRM